jgi:hypothetical protein
MTLAVKTVRDVRDLDWTIVRVPMLTDKPASGKVKVGYLGKGVGTQLSRADMAQFMLQHVRSGEYSHLAPVISN